MANRIAQLGKDTLIYGLSSIVGRFLNFLLVPIYTNALRTDEYGVLANIYAYIAFVMILYGHGMDSAFMRFVAERKGDERKQVFTISFASVGVVSLALTAVIVLFATPLAGVIGVQEGLSHLLAVSGIIMLFDTLMTIPYSSLRMDQKPMSFALARLANFIANIVFTVLFLAVLGMGLEGVFFANLLASASTVIVLSGVIKRNFKIGYSFPLHKELLRFALPIIPAGIAGVALQIVDRPIIKALAGDSLLGIYQANYRLGVFMMLVVGMFDYAWRPFFLNHARDEDAKPLFSSIFTYFSAAMFVMFLAVTFFVEDLARIRLGAFSFIHPDYWIGLEIVPYILLGYVFLGFYVNFNVGLVLEKKTSYLPFITGAGALVNVAANVLLLPHYGILGAAWATLLAYAIMAVGMYFASVRFYKVPYEWIKVSGAFFIALALFWFSKQLALEPAALFSLAIKALLLLTYIGALYALRIIRPSHIRSLTGRFFKENHT